MGRGLIFLESDATEEENSCEYRVEWGDHTSVEYDYSEGHTKTEHYGSGSQNVSGFDNAWDVFNDYRSNSDYIEVRLIKIDPDGSESVYAS